MTGILSQDAEYRVTIRDHALLIVYISQGPDALPWRAVQRIDTNPSALMAAQAKAHRLRAGLTVTVWASYVPRTWTADDHHIHLNGVTDITEHTPQHHHTDPEATP